MEATPADRRRLCATKHSHLANVTRVANLAKIAGTRDVLPRDDPGIVDDVLPRRDRLARSVGGRRVEQRRAAVHALCVALAYLAL